MSEALTYNPTRNFPFVYMRNETTSIGLDSTVIFSSEKHCVLDSVYIFNPTDSLLNISMYLQKNTESGNTRFDLFKRLPLEVGQRIEVLDKSTFYLGAGDMLFASVADATDIATVVISYRELNNQK